MSSDRRIHKRIPLTLSVAKPIRLELAAGSSQETIPGILVNISAGGMALIVFHKLPRESKVEFNLNFMGVQEEMVGKIVREEEKFSNTYLIGVEFDKTSTKFKEIVENMAQDHDICEFRYLTQLENACFPECFFRSLCGKRIKKEF